MYVSFVKKKKESKLPPLSRNNKNKLVRHIAISAIKTILMSWTRCFEEVFNFSQYTYPCLAFFFRVRTLLFACLQLTPRGDYFFCILAREVKVPKCTTNFVSYFWSITSSSHFSKPEPFKKEEVQILSFPYPLSTNVHSNDLHCVTRPYIELWPRQRRHVCLVMKIFLCTANYKATLTSN